MRLQHWPFSFDNTFVDELARASVWHDANDCLFVFGVMGCNHCLSAYMGLFCAFLTYSLEMLRNVAWSAFLIVLLGPFQAAKNDASLPKSEPPSL